MKTGAAFFWQSVSHFTQISLKIGIAEFCITLLEFFGRVDFFAQKRVPRKSFNRHMLEIHIIMNSAVEDILAFKTCCGLKVMDQNLEIHVKNSGIAP